jgi:hypothetical protein
VSESLTGLVRVQSAADVGRVRPATESVVGALDVWAFVLPAVSFIEVTIVGRLFLTEVLFLLMLPWLWSAQDRLRLPAWLFVVWAGWLLGQIVTDLIVESRFEDYARGWATILVTLTNLAAILVLVATPRRVRLFAVGLAVGGVLGYVFVPSPYAATDPWKWALALPIGLALASLMSRSQGSGGSWPGAVAFAAFGLLNLMFGYRSLGGVSLLTAGLLLLMAFASGRDAAPRRGPVRVAIGMAFLSIAVVGTLQIYDFAASNGLLGAQAEATYVEQSGSLGVLVGGRSEILVTSQAIVDSPILGHGSWAADYAYVDLLAERRSSLGYELGGEFGDIGLIPAHSYLMGTWVWAGFLGGFFWLAILALAVWTLIEIYTERIELAPLIVFSTILLAWNIAFSPYGFSGRITAPFAIALCLLARRLVAEGREVNGTGQQLAAPR